MGGFLSNLSEFDRVEDQDDLNAATASTRCRAARDARRRPSRRRCRHAMELPPQAKYYQSEVDALSQFHDWKLSTPSLKVATIKQNPADDDARLWSTREISRKPSKIIQTWSTYKKFEPYGNMWESGIRG